MRRIATLVLALLIAVAAPAKAWCEASCEAATRATDATTHCPLHKSDSGSSMTAHKSDCPAVALSRPALSKLEAVAAALVTPVQHVLVAPATSHRTPHSSTPAPPHLHPIPLRI